MTHSGGQTKSEKTNNHLYWLLILLIIFSFLNLDYSGKEWKAWTNVKGIATGISYIFAKGEDEMLLFELVAEEGTVAQKEKMVNQFLNSDQPASDVQLPDFNQDGKTYYLKVKMVGLENTSTYTLRMKEPFNEKPSLETLCLILEKGMVIEVPKFKFEEGIVMKGGMFCDLVTTHVTIVQNPEGEEVQGGEEGEEEEEGEEGIL